MQQHSLRQAAANHAELARMAEAGWLPQPMGGRHCFPASAAVVVTGAQGAAGAYAVLQRAAAQQRHEEVVEQWRLSIQMTFWDGVLGRVSICSHGPAVFTLRVTVPLRASLLPDWGWQGGGVRKGSVGKAASGCKDVSMHQPFDIWLVRA